MKTGKNNTAPMMLVSAMIIFGTIGIFRKHIFLPSSIIACVRGAIGAIFLIAVVKLQKKSIRHGIGLKNTALLALSGAMMGFNWILLFEAYNYTTVSVATLCYYMAPLIVIILAPIVFREKLTVKKAVCTLAAMIGMVFVSGIPENGLPGAEEAKGIIMGLGAAALYAVIVMLNKKLKGIDAYEKTIIQLLSSAIVLVPYILLTEDVSAVRIDTLSVILLLVLCFVHTGIAYMFYFGSIDGLKAQSVAIISYLDPIAALILSAVFLKETMSQLGIVGAVLVIGAAIVSETECKILKRK